MLVQQALTFTVPYPQPLYSFFFLFFLQIKLQLLWVFVAPTNPLSYDLFLLYFDPHFSLFSVPLVSVIRLVYLCICLV